MTYAATDHIFEPLPEPTPKPQWIDFGDACKQAKSLFNALGLGRKVFDEHKHLFSQALKGKAITHPVCQDAYLSMEESMEEQWRWVHHELGLTRVFSDTQVKEQAERDAWFWFQKMFPRQHSKYTPEMADKGRRTQSDRADKAAAEAMAMKASGMTASDIAQKFGKCVRTIRYWFKRTVSVELITNALSVFNGGAIRNSPVTTSTEFNTSSLKETNTKQDPQYRTTTDCTPDDPDSIFEDETYVIEQLKKHWEGG